MRAGLLLLLAALLAPARPAAAWGRGYAVDCPQRCDPGRCSSGRRCETSALLDDCGCCRVCAAGRGATCYRTVVGMDGVKCGPGLRCQFSSEEDDFGDEYGVCRDCPYGTFGLDCKEHCRCRLGLCDRATGRCLKFPFVQPPVTKPSDSFASPAEQDAGSGDGEAAAQDPVEESPARTPVAKRLDPR